MTTPTFLPYYVLIGAAGAIMAVIIGLRRAVAASGPQHIQARVGSASAVLLIGWFVLAVALAWFGAYRGTTDRIPTIQYGIVVPIVVGVWLFSRAKAVRGLVEAIPQAWLVGVQLYRALGVIFVILYASGQLSGLFAWPAGLGDIAVGLSAPVVARMYSRNPVRYRGLVRAWNIAGIIDLVIAISAGFMTSPSPVQLFGLDKPNELITAFPLVLIPVFLVPLSILFHLASLARLRHSTQRLSTRG
jgi:hypothetical protein